MTGPYERVLSVTPMIQLFLRMLLAEIRAQRRSLAA
jgi:hypothetical protein